MATVANAVLARRSVRAFLDRPVDRATVAGILAAAGRAPSGGNVQPWHVDVLAGEALAAQEAWALVHQTVGETLGLPEDRLLYCGMALGFADEAHPINAWRTDREPLESVATFAGF